MSFPLSRANPSTHFTVRATPASIGKVAGRDSVNWSQAGLSPEHGPNSAESVLNGPGDMIHVYCYVLGRLCCSTLTR